MRKQCETREKLLETAIQLIWQSNYNAVGVNEICTQAGVTKGSFYHHFESKSALFKAASEHHWEQVRTDLDAIFSPSRTPLEQLEGLIEDLLKKQRENEQEGNPVSGCPFFTSGAQCGSGEAVVRQTARDMSLKFNAYARHLVANLRLGGYLASEGEPETLGRMMQYYVQGLLLYGRIFQSLDLVENDVRDGLYRLLDLKAEYRQQPAKTKNDETELIDS